MDFHVWSDGVQGGPDSFFDNASTRNSVSGHIAVSVNSTSSSVIAVEAFGITGPPTEPDRFTTFLVTIDLSSFNIELQGGQQ